MARQYTGPLRYHYRACSGSNPQLLCFLCSQTKNPPLRTPFTAISGGTADSSTSQNDFPIKEKQTKNHTFPLLLLEFRTDFGFANRFDALRVLKEMLSLGDDVTNLICEGFIAPSSLSF